MTKTKRILSMLTALCMLLTLAPVSVFANVTTGKCGTEAFYSYDDVTKTLTITGTGAIRDYNTLSSVAPWYDYCEQIESIVIESGVTGIGSYAFYYFKGLTSITIPDTVTYIGEGAFYECTALESVTIPDSITSIGKEAFQYSGLTSVTVPGSVTNIADSTFYGCKNLASVEIKYGVEYIGDYAFNGCGNLSDITLPDSVTGIGSGVFDGTAYCKDENNYDNGVLYIGNHLVKADTSISGVCTVRSGTKIICNYAFAHCDSLTNINLPDTLTVIGSYSFQSSGLTDITIPQSVTVIGDSAFAVCIDLTNITVADGNTAYRSQNGILYNKAKTEIICYPKAAVGDSFAIPNGITKIADSAFERCWNLKNITIAQSVTSIGADAFNSCYALTDISIPDGVESIGAGAFFECSALKSVTIPNSVANIGESAFMKCGKLNKVNYVGSKEDWTDIEKGSGYSIPDDIIVYLKGIKAVRSADGKIVVTPLNTDNGKTVILALYNGNKLAEVHSQVYNGTQITFVPSKTYTTAKAMIWSDFNTLSPECGIKIIK